MLTLREKHEYEQEIAQLTKKVRLLTANNSKWKKKYHDVKGVKPNLRNSRTSRAEVFVKSWIAGDKSLTFRQIAGLCFISIETVKNISYKLRHKLV
ncbi:MAG: hypothetical protein COA84_14975 [Robiginitomaculum sp.]|nr:MAG: hypothetical protein COA84_14975 [Robiginitomaculum sp.]